ncbi:MAG: efflux RND transporter periplasmic adaptor subunit [Cyclobacteriaceae bacterium]|nr:efflux RND transporter periplasmic adaptor subunit [Cyclobacteriaceae bacterium]MCH8517404.1 efflux RND transporter periplasmic adaptor subunit [Cyclobacteriaceae bacterium]
MTRSTYHYRNIAICFILGLFVASCQSQKEQQDEPLKVVAYKVQKEYIKIRSEYPARVVALQEVVIRADVSGFITRILIEDGDQVQKGDLLYEVDTRRYRARSQEAAARLRIAKENKKRVEQDLARYEKLQAENAIPRQTYENTLIELENASAQIEAAEAELENLSVDLKYTKVYAPFDGTLGFSDVRLGDLVTAGSTALNTISSDDPMAVDLQVNEDQIPYYRDLLNQQNEARQLNDSLFKVRLNDGSYHGYPAHLRRLDRAVDENTGTIRVRLVVDNPEFYLRPGQSCRVSVKDERSGKHLLVPEKAIKEDLGEYFVFVIGDDNKIEQRRIHKGATADGSVIIEKGLSEEELIVKEGVGRVSDGDQVKFE